MPELPVSVRLALWVSRAWADDGDLSEAVARAHPDADDVGGDLDRLGLWRDLGERAVLVALPAPGDSVGMPTAPPATLAAATAAGECVLAPSLGGILVPDVGDYGPEGDRGLRVRWAAHDADPVPPHRVEALDAREAARDLARTVARATTELEGWGGRPFDPDRARAEAEQDRGQWALPREIPGDVAATIRSAAAVATTAETGSDGCARRTRLGRPRGPGAGAAPAAPGRRARRWRPRRMPRSPPSRAGRGSARARCGQPRPPSTPE